MTTQYDAIIIGTGQAGPPLAGRLTTSGLKVAIIERKLFGGTCVNTGCIPTKTMVASAYAAREAQRAAEHDAERDGPPRQVGGVGAGNQGLGGRAAGVDAGAAEQLALDDGDLHPGLAETNGKGRARLAGADDDCVEAAIHDANLRLRPPDHVRPGRRGVTSWTIHILPSGSLKEKEAGLRELQRQGFVLVEAISSPATVFGPACRQRHDRRRPMREA